jgi:hypothetical protein
MHDGAALAQVFTLGAYDCGYWILSDSPLEGAGFEGSTGMPVACRRICCGGGVEDGVTGIMGHSTGIVPASANRISATWRR